MNKNLSTEELTSDFCTDYLVRTNNSVQKYGVKGELYEAVRCLERVNRMLEEKCREWGIEV